MRRRHPRSTLFPYTTLFRSDDALKALARGQHAEALTSLRRAQEMKPRSALQEQTYGLDFVDYLPYYYQGDRKSTRLNSSHSQISYAVFCLKKKKTCIKNNVQ